MEQSLFDSTSALTQIRVGKFKHRTAACRRLWGARGGHAKIEVLVMIRTNFH